MLKHKKTSKKGDNGKVLIIGGSKEYVGCLTLAGIACLRSGVDWVTVACPEKAAWAVNKLSPDLVTAKLKGDYISLKHYKEIKKLAEKHDVILIGNGITLKSKQIVNKLIKTIDKLLVIDADAIKAISLTDVNNAILTPHEKELDIFLKNSKLKKLNKIKDKKQRLKQLQKYINNNIILLKGPIDYIISKNKIKTNNTGNERMSVAGTGDVLAGITAGYLAQTKDNFKAAYLAAKNNGKIGDFLYKKFRYSYIASDMLSLIKKE